MMVPRLLGGDRFLLKKKDQKCHAPIGELIISPAAGCPPCRIYVSRSGSHRGKLVDVFIYIYIYERVRDINN